MGAADGAKAAHTASHCNKSRIGRVIHKQAERQMPPSYKTILLSLACTALAACGADRYVKRAEKHAAIGEYYDAAAMYKQAYQKTPAKEREKRGLMARSMAYCYSKTNQAPKAQAALRNTVRYGQDRPEDHAELARQLLKTGSYKEAAKEFATALDSMPQDRLALSGLVSADSAQLWKETGSRYTVKKMEVFNSRRADYCPMLFGDNYNALYFTSTRNEAMGDGRSGITGTKPGDIFVSEKDEKGKWGKPKPAGGDVNSEYDEGACSFSSDQKKMYLALCSSDPSYPRYAKVVASARADASWGKPSEITISRDTLSAYAHPAESPDGAWLYFVSDMPGGKGGYDIWRARITKDGLGGAENIGEPVNTPGNELFPTFRTNGDLYFSSDGHIGMGGLDIYIAKAEAGGYRIEHPGYPLNSQGDDFGMTFEGPHNRGFFSSNRNDAHGWDHIYSFENPEIVQTVKGWVYEADGYELPAAEVHFIGSDGTNEKVGVRGDGSFVKVVKPGVDYIMMASCKGFLNHQEQLSVKPTEESEETVLQFPLASISAPVLIDNIFYDFDKATLRAESAQALDKLVVLLNENPHVTIELSSHCDYKGTAGYNKRLSQRRAESVVSYLTSHGIAQDRLTPAGYGKEKPKTIKKKLTERYPWLKEGDVLTEEFIKGKGEKEREICNQLNRRTEFKVLRTTYGMFDGKGKLKEQPKPAGREEAPEGEELYFEF